MHFFIKQFSILVILIKVNSFLPLRTRFEFYVFHAHFDWTQKLLYNINLKETKKGKKLNKYVEVF